MVPIVLIHGFPFDSAMWQAQAAFLRSPDGGGHEVLTPDLPGFGPAPMNAAPVAEKASIRDFAEEIHRLIERHGGKAVVGGFSMGGYVLLSLLRAYPQDVAAAMFIDTRAEADSVDARAVRLKSIEDVRKNGTGFFFETMAGRLLGKNPSNSGKRQTRMLMDRQSVDAVVAAQSAMARRPDQSDLLAQVKVPVLIVVGEEDVVTPPVVAQAMQKGMPHARLVRIEAAGHMTPVEQPEAVNGAIKAFLDTLGK